MNKIEKLRAHYKEMGENYRDLGVEIARLEESQRDPRTMVENHGTYYMIDDRGMVRMVLPATVTSKSDEQRFDFGNMFPTREAAEKHAKRLRVFNLMWQYSDVMNKYRDTIDNFHVAVESNNTITTIDLGNHYGVASFKVKGDAQRAVELIGEKEIKEAMG